MSWRRNLVLQMPREKHQLLLAELLLVFHHTDDVASPDKSSLLVDADVVASLRYDFLTARLRLTPAQLTHLGTSARLTFSLVLLPLADKKRLR